MRFFKWQYVLLNNKLLAKKLEKTDIPLPLYSTKGEVEEMKDRSSKEFATLNEEKPKTSTREFNIFQSSRELPGLNNTFLLF